MSVLKSDATGPGENPVALYAASRALLAVADRQESVSAILEVAQRTLRASATGLARVSTQSDSLEVDLHPGEPPLTEAAVRTWAQRAMQAGEVLLRDSAGPGQAGDVLPRGSVLACPLKVRETWLGVLVLWRDPASPPFARFELPTAEILAGQIAIVLERAQLQSQLSLKRQELKDAHRQLARTEAQAQAIIATAQEAIILFDREGRVCDLNAEALEMFGRPREQTVGRNLADFAIPSGRLGSFREHIETAYRQGKDPANGCREVMALRANGEEFPLEISTAAIETPRGRLLSTFARDITERKRAEEALRESEERYRLLFENNLAGVVRTTREGRILECNQAMANMMGYDSVQEVLTHMVQDFYFSEAERAEFLEKLKVEGRLTNSELRLRRKDGSPVWLIANLSPAAQGPNGPQVIEAILFDITERKQAEQRARLLTTALESAANGIMIANREGRIVWVNPAFTRLSGYSAAEVVGQTPRIWKSGAQDPAFYQKLWNTVLSGEVWQGEIINRRKDGTTYSEGMTITPVCDATGEVSHFIAIKQDISERKRAERALQERTVYLNTLFELSPLGIVVLDPHGCIQMANSAFERLFLHSRDEVLGANLDDLIVPADLASEARTLTGLCLTGPGAFLTSSRRRKNGTLVDVDIYGVPLVIEGELRGVLALYHDITERKRAEADLVRYAEDLEISKAAQEEHAQELARLVKELARERDLLGAVMDNLPDYVFYKDCQSRFLRTNPAHAKALGLADPQQAVGKTDFDFFPREDAQAYFRDERQVIETGQPLFGRVEKVREPNGQYRWCFTNKVPIRDSQGRVTGLVGITRDITERKQAEETLRASEERYRELFLNASDIVYTTDLDGRFTSLNRVGQQTLGYSEEEASQLDLWQLIAPRHREIVKQGRARVLAGESDMTAEAEFAAKDGRRVVLEVKPRLIYKDGRPIGIQAIARDITGRDEAEMELRHAQKLESVGRLASGIAHEINTPIQFVGDNTRFLRDCFACLETLLGKYQELRDAAASGNLPSDLLPAVRRLEEESDLVYLREEIPKALTQTLEGVERVATIVRAMKEFAHPESKEMAAADLNKALLSTLTVARNELKYVADVETALGDLPLVVCNVGDLNQVFLNLLVNAAHAIADVVKGTGTKGKIRVRTAAEGEAVLIAISDTGSGIPEAIRNRIYDPFFTTKEVGRGTGQGLAIARSVVVDRHKGNLTFESEVGKGTTFYIRLPVEPGGCSKETKGP